MRTHVPERQQVRPGPPLSDRLLRFVWATAVCGALIAPLALWLFGFSVEALLFWLVSSALMALSYAMEDDTPIDRLIRKAYRKEGRREL